MDKAAFEWGGLAPPHLSQPRPVLDGQADVHSARTGGNGLTAASTSKRNEEEDKLLAEAVVAALALASVCQDTNKIVWVRTENCREVPGAQQRSVPYMVGEYG
jgi:hypothetical protein